jgi:tRNA threonylcarbamoyladenosine biosynthesis protein TsaB
VKLLAIDTALNACSAAIVDGDVVLACVSSAGGKGNAERLLPLLEQLRQEAGIALGDLDGIAATVGPGSFTGIRTALAAARGLGLALGRPVWGVTTTAALAKAAAAHGPGQGIVAVIDARRDEVYIQVFATDGAPVTEPLLLPLTDAAALLPAGPLLLVGSGSALLKDAARRADLVLSPADPDPDPVIVAQLAAAMPPPDHAPAPLYIRPPDAALPKEPEPRARLAVEVETCGTAAAEVLAVLHAEAFPHEPWSADSLRALLAMPGALALTASAGGQPVGFILLRRAADEAEVITLAVTPRLRRLGVARRLLDAGLQQFGSDGVTRCFLEVASDNRAARGLYLAGGFAEVGRRAAYYQTPAGPRDAIVLEWRREAAPVLK